MKKQTHYECLGVPETATAEDVKQAFRTQAKVHHPDHNPGDTTSAERFCEVKEAYEVLSDPQRRAAYDRRPREPNLEDMLREWARTHAASPTPVTHARETASRVVPPVSPPTVPNFAASPPVQLRSASTSNVGDAIAMGVAAMAFGAVLAAAFGGASGQARGPDGRFK